jgi:hypothetical protein
MDGNVSLEKAELKLRSVESVVLAIAIERHPVPFAMSELLTLMRAADDHPNRATEVRAAVEGLSSVGLLHRSRGVVSPTPASLRAAELELGLPLRPA